MYKGLKTLLFPSNFIVYEVGWPINSFKGPLNSFQVFFKLV